MLTISLLLCAALALSQATGAKGAEEGVVATAAENRNQCPTGWFQYESRCFMFVETARTWPLAERHCVSLGANLASVHSSAEYQFLQVVVGCKAGGFSPTWIGGYDAVQDRLWFWSDGSKFDYQNWKKGEPNNSGGREPCMVMNWGDEYRWNDISCGNSFPSVCSKSFCCSGAKVAEEAVAAAENRNQCPTGWFQFGSRCFMFVETARTWPLSEHHCVSIGANLASVHSSAENQFLQEVVGSKIGGFSTTWIGGFDAVQDRLWFWSDGSKFDYQNWKKGEPNNSGGREPCMVMNWGDEYCWNDINCGNSFPSVCSKIICEIEKN